METVRIKVNDYYGNPSYYSVMPQEIFDALELASLNGDELTMVNKAQFDSMIIAYDNKMKQQNEKEHQSAGNRNTTPLL